MKHMMSEDEAQANFLQAELLLQAGINSSLAGQDADALTLIEAAEQRFTKLRKKIDAGIARAWKNGLTKVGGTAA